jgi:hypothetical protein
MTARLSNADLRRLGLVPDKKRTTRRTASGPFHHRCVTCGEEFTTDASETRHLNAERHYRYELLP